MGGRLDSAIGFVLNSFMPQPVDDHHLRTAFYDAMRTLKLPPPKGRLTDQERDMIANAIMAMVKRCHWEVICDAEIRPSAMSVWFGNKTE